MEKLTLYTTGCPKCKVLEKKLQDKNIKYDEVTDTDIMIGKGFNEAPILEKGDETLNFSEAIKWINSL